MKRFTTEAIVLKSSQFKDADKIYTLLSKDFGKLSALAKGVRKITSRRAGSLDSLNHILVQINTSADFNFITEVQIINSFGALKKDLGLIKQAFYIRELLYKSVWEDTKLAGVFDLAVSTLARLENEEIDSGIVINKFEIKLMQMLGYQPPQSVLNMWVQEVNAKNFQKADFYIKSYISNILEEDLNSLKLV